MKNKLTDLNNHLFAELERLSDRKWFRWILCKVFEYHVPENKVKFDGHKVTSVCRHCGREITKNSNGNWI